MTATPEIRIQGADGTRERFPLDKEKVTIGRSRESDIFLPDQWLSRHHAEIRRQEHAFWLVDLGSKNGTLLNGAPVGEQRRLRPGDVITLGEHLLLFTDPDNETRDEPVLPVEGTRVFSARELSDVITKPATDAEQMARQNRILHVLSGAAKTLIEHKPIGEVFETVLDMLFETLPAERGAILLVEGTEPVIKASRTRKGQPITHVSRSITRHVLEKRELLVLANIMEDAQFNVQDSIMSTGIRSAVCAPLWYKSADAARDSVIGVVYLDSVMRPDSFGDDDVTLLSALANVAAAKIENARLLEEALEKKVLQEEMRVAAEIQRGLLPREAPTVDGYGLAGSNQPCRTVGGDYYDFMAGPDGVLLALGDVSGKGTAAALLMTVLRAAVRGQWSESTLSSAMSRINHTVCQNVPSNKFITFFLARLDPVSGQLGYVNAGHNPPQLVRADGTRETLDRGGTVLGLFEGAYDEGSVEIRPGDTLVLYSDGVTETTDPSDEEFGEDRLTEVIRRGRGLDAAGLQAAVLEEIERFGAGAKAADDRTLIVLKRY